MKMELRNIDMKLNAEKETMTVSGYVNKVGELSEVLGSAKKFVEKVAPGAFYRAIDNMKGSVDFLAEHDEKLLLASTRNGSLQLTEDSTGLYMSATIASTSWGKDYYELIKNGLYKNLSFGFRTIKDSWKAIENGLMERTIEELELLEVSAVKNPAYSQSSISARSIEILDNPEMLIEQSQSDKKQEKKLRLEIDIRKKKDEIKNLEDASKVLTGVDTSSHIARAEDSLSELENESRQLEENDEEMEKRELNTTVNKTTGIQVAEIVKKSDVKSSVFDKAKKVEMTSEEIMVPIEQSFEDAEFVDEGEAIPEINLNLNDFASLKQKRVGAAINASKKLVYESGTNLEEYLKELVLRRTEKRLEKAILVGSTNKEFKGITADEEVKTVQFSEEPTFDMLRDLYKGIKNEFIKNAVFYIEENYFDKVAKLKMTDGSYLVQETVMNGEVVQTIFGRKVEVTDSLTANKPVVFASIEDCYTVGVNSDLVVRPINNDAQHALAGKVAFVAEFYGDGCVTNYEAVATCSLSPTA